MLWQQVEDLKYKEKKAQDFSIHTSCIVMLICDDAYRLKDFDLDVANHWHRHYRHCAAGRGHMFSLAMLLL